MPVSKGSTRRWAAIPFLVGITLLLLGPGSAATAVGASGTPLGLPNVASEVGVLVSPAFLSTGSIREVGPMPENAPISVTVGLSPSNGAGLAEAIALEYTPGSAQYHHYLTATEIADRFGPSPASYDRAVQYFRSFGLSVTTSPDRSMLFVSGTAGGVGTAFGTSFAYYQGGDRTFYSHPTPARLPAGIPWQGVVGLGNESAIRPSATPLLRAPAPASAPSASCPSSSWVTPCLAHSAYNLTSLLSAGFNGTGYRVGIVDTYDAAETQSQLASDYSSFVQGFALPHGNVSYVYPVPISGNLNRTYTGWGAEEALDLEWTRAMAPGASIDMTLAPNSNTGLYESVDWLVAHDAVNVITMSWGENDVGVFNSFAGGCQSACNASSDGSYETLHPVLEAAAAEGISVFAASGDCGAADGTNGVSTNYPASDPYVTGVGGTDLTLTSSGGFGGESGWSGNSSGSGSPGCQNQGGSGGGYSPFPRPSWQSATGVPAKPALRGVPDVAMIGGSPGAEIVIGGSLSAEGGTSLSSPMWAGVAAVADSDAGTALGFLNPSLYGVARGSSGHSAFHNVSGGYNGYSAGKGWNPVTGLGSPNAMVLIPLLSASTVPASTTAVALTANPRFGAAPLTVRVHANATGGSAPASFFDVSFGDGNSTTTVNGNATYTYTKDGVYPVIATEFDTSGNSSTSQPVAVVVGGGGPLTVSLNVTPARPAIDASVTFQTNVTGGVGPFTYSYLFGDGTNLLASNQSVVTHGYGFSGGFCPVVVVSDAQQPPDGGESSAVGVLVGGAATARCAIS
ncbi:MAG TPA: protease pro-enzyme activation domain-containing protein, partial [Thermoplasmata archaeon]|nr:protease pro-enzyme activation domain-containing protein [Thermoplasmata archaeon]